MNGRYCVDANVFITAWYASYPIRVFPSLWEQISQHKADIVLIQPIYDEIEPVLPADRQLPTNKKRQKFPLRMWLEDNQFEPYSVSAEIENASLELARDYQIEETSKGASQNDIMLIAYARSTKKIVVTFESPQQQTPMKKCSYKIPLICKERNVDCIDFITMISELGIRM